MQKLNGTRNFLAFSALAFVLLTLHGCGTTPASSTTPTPTPTQPKNASATVVWLNNLFMGFDENDDDSPLGVPISMLHYPRFQDNLFCSTLMNTTCYHGMADCRTSAALYNHQMMLQCDRKSRTPIYCAKTINRPRIFELGGFGVGFVINPTRVQNDIGKCAYAYDGHTFGKLNGGCGAMASVHPQSVHPQSHRRPHPGDCSSRSSAFYDICPSTNKTCTADDVEIKNQTCSPGTSGSSPSRCFWGMPSLNYPGNLRPNYLREMVKFRLKEGRKSPIRVSFNNEIVLDDRLLIPAIRSDPATVVSAFVYLKSINGSRSKAEGMRDRFSEDYSVGKIPVVGFDDTVDFTPEHGPFIIEEDGGLAVTMV